MRHVFGEFYNIEMGTVQGAYAFEGEVDGRAIQRFEFIILFE